MIYSNYNDNEDCLASYSFEDKRNASSSLYMPRNDDFENINTFSDCLEASNVIDENSSSSSRYSSMNDSKNLAQNQKTEYEQSAPGSTEVDSEEDCFESHFDALDELSGLFESETIKEPKSNRSLEFARPANPNIKDSQFCLPRYSAPAPMLAKPQNNNLEVSEIKFSSSFSPMNRGLNMSCHNRSSGALYRPMARK